MNKKDLMWKIEGIVRLIVFSPILLAIIISFGLLYIWELFDKHILSTEYENRSKHYRSF